jgi:hypothetical protein
MSDTWKLEHARAASEARDLVAFSRSGSTAAAVATAMRRYLGAEQYHELKDADGQSAGEPNSADQTAKPSASKRGSTV